MQNKQALLIIDIQNDYFEGGKNPLVNAMEACQNTKKILDVFRQKQLPVFHIQHLSTRADATFFLPNTYGAEIHELLTPTEYEQVVVKHFPNSFRDTNLLQLLQTEQITDLVICGMMTQMCIDATTRAAKDLGFNCTVISDCCATKDLQFKHEITKAKDVQNAFLAGLSYFYATVIDSDMFLK